MPLLTSRHLVERKDAMKTEVNVLILQADMEEHPKNT